MKRQITLILSLTLAGFGGWTVFPAQAEDAAKSGREILAKCQQAVVTVKLAIKQSMSMGGHDSKSESKTETTGTVIDPSGLTVVSLATTDPGQRREGFLHAGDGRPRRRYVAVQTRK